MNKLTHNQIVIILQALTSNIEDFKETRDDPEMSLYWREYFADVIKRYEETKQAVMKLKEESDEQSSKS